MADQADPLVASLAKKKAAGGGILRGLRRARPSPVKKKAGSILPKLTEGEQDLVWHMENGYQLQTDTLGGDPVLRRLKGHEVFRPPSANRNTIKALEERGLITPLKGRDPLTIVWKLKNKAQK